MLFLYFNGIKNKKGEYIVEVSQTAESERRIMNVSSAFFMKIPAELLNTPLDTLRNANLRQQFDSHEDTRFVKSIRNHFGQKMISGEVVKLETNLSVMIDRNVLMPSSTVDKDGVERLVTTGASYDTVSMTCPLTSHLVGFATKMGQPAMIFMSSQDDSAKRPEDAENDSTLALFNEARAKVYDIELLFNPDVVAMNNAEILHAVSTIQSLTQKSIEAELEEKNVAANSSWTSQFSAYKVSEELDIEEAANFQVSSAETLLEARQKTLREIEEKALRIKRITKTITDSWKEIQERKVIANGNPDVITNLLKEGAESKELGVVSAHLPITHELGNLIESKYELEDELKVIDTTTKQVSESKNVIQDAPQSSIPKNTPSTQTASTTKTESKPTEPDGTSVKAKTDKTPAAEIKSTNNNIQASNQNNINSVVTDVIEQNSEAITQQIPEMKPSAEKLQETASSETKLETSSQPSETKPEPAPIEAKAEILSQPIFKPTLSERLQKLYDRAEKVLTEVECINSKIEEIKKESDKRIKDITPIADAVKAARVERNKTIVNWPAAKDLINKSKSGFSFGYTQWNWYYTNFPNLVVNYILELLMEKGRWGDVKFTTLEDKSIPTHVLLPNLSRQDGINSYKQILQKMAPKNIFLPDNVLYLLRTFLFGQPRMMDQFLSLLDPHPHQSFRSENVGRVELSIAEDQLKKIFKLLEEATTQTDKTKQKLLETLNQLAELNKKPTDENSTAERITLQREATLLDMRLQKYKAAKEKALNTYVAGQQWIAEKTPRISHADTIWATPKNETISTPDSNSTNNATSGSEDAKAQANHKLEMDLRTAVLLKKTDKFKELYAKADSEVIKKLEAYCQNKKLLLAKYNELKNATQNPNNNSRPGMSKR